MLYLLSEWNGRRFAFPASRVVEVLPCVRIGIPGPRALGLVDYRGEPLPVIDLNLLVHGERTEPRMGTRVLVIETGPDNRRFGVLVAGASGTERLADAEWAPAGAAAPFADGVAARPGGLVERVDVERLWAWGGEAK